MRGQLKSSGVEIADDPMTRQLYATDGSIYQILPQAVAFPKDPGEAARLLEVAAGAEIPVTPRGAGTGLVGGALGAGLIVDFARHNNQIRHFDRERGIVTVGPGVVLDQLNQFLRPHQLMFGPDVATSSRATIGGMIGNNSSGARVPRYGTTSDHLHSLTVATLDGKLTRVDHHQVAFPDATRWLNRELGRRRRDLEPWKSSTILKRWPGYALHRWNPGQEGWPSIFCGSEGTLAGIVEAELRVLPLPARKALAIAHFADPIEAMQASVTLRSLDPAAIEHIDRILLDQTRGQLAFRKARSLLGIDSDPSESILIVEFDQDLGDRLRTFEKLRLGQRTQWIISPSEIGQIWGLRKAGLSLLTGCRGAAKPTTGIEDAALPPEALPDYVRQLKAILNRLDLDACFYGHAAAGLLHVRPVVNLQDRRDRIRFRKVAEEVSALVRQFKGSIAAEHGVGIARAEFMSDHIPPGMLTTMKALKRRFDPKDLMNPGKIFGGPQWAIDQNLRIVLKGDDELPFRPQLRYAKKDDTFSGHLNQCNGCGGCRKQTGTMCPTYMATGEESMSTRGRANLIRLALTSPERVGGLLSLDTTALDHALHHCLGCKACATECPSNVDLSLLKAELLQARFDQSGIPLPVRILSEVDFMGRLGTLAPRWVNRILSTPGMRRLAEAQLGLSTKRPLPLFAPERFDRWFRRHSPAPSQNPAVLLWDDTFTRYYEPSVGQAAVGLLEAIGYRVVLISERACCGRPAMSQGNLRRARSLAQFNLAQLNRYPEEWPILFLEPSCFSMFFEDYAELGIEETSSLKQRCFLMEDFLVRETDRLEWLGWSVPDKVAVHLHCHAKTLLPMENAQLSLTNLFPNGSLLDSSCCGMAGAFGALSKTYDLSLKIARPLIDQIDRHPPSTPILASGTSCRQQLRHLTKHPVLHPVELISNHFKTNQTKINPF